MMRAGFFKRLLAIMLVLVLLLPVVPASFFTRAYADSTVTIYFDNTLGWGNVYGYVWDVYQHEPVGPWPGTKMQQAEHFLYKLTVPTTNGIGFRFTDNYGWQTPELGLSDEQVRSGYSYYVKGESTEVKVCRFPVEENGKVTFTYEGNASKVQLAGSMNNWTPVNMVKNGSTFTYSILLEEGRYEYKLIVDGNWINDPMNPMVNDDNDHNNYLFVTGGVAQEETVLVAGSDFQAGTHAASAANVTALLSSVKNNGGYLKVDGFLFAGDYSTNWTATETNAGAAALKTAVDSVYPGLSDKGIYIQGNHDPAESITGGTLTASGAHDADSYGVYVINEDDLDWHEEGTEEEAKATASALSSYLESKIRAGYNQPIFVVSHIPLHYTMRTHQNGDGRYANYVFDALNHAAGVGLNIIYLFGHHHSASWLDSQGGSALFYTRGDKLNIPQCSKTEYREETLNFTYMNAGFVGYYRTTNSTAGVAQTLNMSVFEISGNDVKISRYSTTGLHALKTAGVANTAYQESWAVDTRVVSSPQTLETEPMAVSSNGVSFSAPDVTEVTATLVSTELAAGYSVYHTYDILPEGYVEGTTAVISVPLDSGFSAGYPVKIIDETTGTVHTHNAFNGRVCFETNHSGRFILAQDDIGIYSATGNLPNYINTQVTSLTAGQYYRIQNYQSKFMLTGNVLVSDTSPTQALELVAGDLLQGDLWYYDGTHLRLGDDEYGYIMISGGMGYIHSLDPALNDKPDRAAAEIFLNNDGQTFTIKRGGNVYCLNNYGGPTSHTAAGYQQDGNSTNSGSRWVFYGLSDAQVDMSVTASKNTLTIDQTAVMTPYVTVEGVQTDDYVLTWSIEDPNVAVVNQNGLVQALRPGKTNVIVTLNEANGFALREELQVKIPINVYLHSWGSTVAGASGLIYSYLVNADVLIPGQPSGPYVISSASNTVYKNLSSHVIAGSLNGTKGLELVPETNVSYLWYYDGEGFRSGEPNGAYLAYSNGIVTVSADKNEAFDTVTYSNGVYTIANSRATGYKYLNQHGGPNHNSVALYSNGDWLIRKLTSPQSVYMTVSPGETAVTVGQTKVLTPAVTVADQICKQFTVSWYSDNPLVATVNGGTVTAVSSGVANITAVLETAYGSDRLSGISVTVPVTVTAEDSNHQAAFATGVVDMGTEHITNIVPGVPSGPYVISNRSSGYVVTGIEGHKSTACVGLKLLESNDYQHLWYYDGTHFRYNDPHGEYLAVENGEVCLSTNVSAAFDRVARYVNADGSLSSGYLIENTKISGARYLNQLGGVDKDAAGLWSGDGTSRWYILAASIGRTVTLSVTPNADSIQTGEKLTLTPKVQLGSYATGNYTINWTSSNPAVASVSNGVVTGLEGGYATITATLTKAGGAECEIAAEISIYVIKTEKRSPSWTTATSGLGIRPVRVTGLPAGSSGPYLITNQCSGSILSGMQEIGSTLPNANAYGLWLRPGLNGDYNDLWYYDGTHLIYGDPNATDRYLVLENGSVGLGSDTAIAYDRIEQHPIYSQSFTIATNCHEGFYLNQLGGEDYEVVGEYKQANLVGSAWNFYALEDSETVVLSAYMEDKSADLLVKEPKKVANQLVLEGSVYHNYTVTYESSDPSIAEVGRDGTVHPLKRGTVTINVRLETIDGGKPGLELVAPLTLNICGIESVNVNTKEGVLPVHASHRLPVMAVTEGGTAPVLTVTYDNGTQRQYPLTSAMLTDSNGNRINTSQHGVYKNVTITYEGVVCSSDFTLHIIKSDRPDYPDYPEEGSVFVNKTASDSQNFQSSGVAQVELSTSGIPVKTGADVIIMLDTSSSMGATVEDANGEMRLNVLCQSLNDLINGFQEKAEDGTMLDVRVAIADFNGFYHDEYSPYYIDPKETMSNSSIRTGSNSEGLVFTGDQTLSDGAFINASEMGLNPFTTNRNYQGPTSGKYTLKMASGTNYDYALDAVYQMGMAINDVNAAAGEDRDLFVIFMSDGAPFQYNFFSSQSGTDYWSKYLMGQMEDDMFAAQADRSFYHPEGKHWMAEAIKGDRAQEFPVIRKNDGRDTNNDNWINVEGLGATLYSIGFCLKVDDKITVESMEHVIKKIASEEKYAFFADTAAELKNVFVNISNDIMYAASGAYFVDTIGKDYDLLMGHHTYTMNSVTQTFTDSRIEVRSYSIYTMADLEQGLCTEDQLGVRKQDASGNPIYTREEVVTFSADGTKAYSDKVTSTAADGTVTHPNILSGGVIMARSFRYNTTSSTRQVTRSNGTTYSLAAETFLWEVGSISTDEKALNYYVCLKGSVEGKVNAGIYPTNESAVLYYENYLRNHCQLTAPVPSMPWSQAQVGYGFYLVDKSGNPIVNKDTGMTGSFEQSVKSVVLAQTQYLQFLTGSSVSLVAREIIPGDFAGLYRLFDKDARYDVRLDGDGTGTISVFTDGVVSLSTYITGLRSTAFKDGDVGGTPKMTTNFANANTTVWFAVTVADDTVEVDKTVAQVEGEENCFTLTLDAYVTGSAVKAPNSTGGSAAQMVELDETTIMKEVLSDYFALTEEQTLSTSVRAYTAAYEGVDINGNHQFSDELVPYPAATVELTKSSANGHYDTVNIGNFDYAKEYIGIYDGIPRGRKLVVKVQVKARDGFWGGNNVPTNDATTGIYVTGNEKFTSFPVPQANVSVAPELSAANKTVYYGTHVDAVKLIDSALIGGVAVNIGSDGTVTPGQDWMDDYATVHWDPSLDTPDTVVSGTASDDYTFGLILKPKTDGENNNERDNPGNIAGDPVDTAKGIASNKATGHVNILVPVITFRDSTVDLGDRTGWDYYESTNRVSTVAWVNRDDPYGTKNLPTTPSAEFSTEPELSFTYTPMGDTQDYFTEDMPINVEVYLGSNATQNNKMTQVVYFDWNRCDSDLHDGNERISDDQTGDSTHRHKGSTYSGEFFVHVTYILTEDTIVIDYGLNVKADALKNDKLPTDGALTAVSETDAVPGLFTEKLNGDYGVSKLSDHGKLEVITGTQGAQLLQYTPTDMEMNDKEVFGYAVKNGDATRYYYSTFTVIPATSIYYEDNFIAYNTYTINDDHSYTTIPGGWTEVGKPVDSTQAEDHPGEVLDSLDANKIYGFDDAYTNMTTYSNGSAMKVTVDENISGEATFTFWGTGFDIISMTNANTGTILAEIINLETDEAVYHMVDTYYGYRYNAEEEIWEVDPDDSDTLYQVPVMKVDMGAYGHYQVLIDVSYSEYLAHNDSGKCDFYLDAIRIYNPARVDASGNIADDVIRDAYHADREAAPTYEELRNMLIGANDFDSLGSDEIKGGVIFIDGNAGLSEDDSYGSVENEEKSYAVSEYINYGPNNELYLAPGQAITFALDEVTSGGRVHLAMKSVGTFGGQNDAIGDGSGCAHVEIFGLDANNNRVNIAVGKGGVISSATDLYYDITAVTGMTVVIRNIGDAGIVSMTNVKITNSAQQQMLKVTHGGVNQALSFLNEGEPAPVEPTAGSINLSYATLSFEEEIKMNVYFGLKDMEPAELGLLTFSTQVAEGTVDTADAVIVGGVLHENGFYSVSTEGIAAKKLGDKICFCVYARLANGSYVYSKVAGYSPVAYANTVLNGNYSAAMKTLVVAMLNYGAAAQTFFGYRTDAPVNQDLTDEQRSMVSDYSAGLMAQLVKPTDQQLGSFRATDGGFLRKYPTVSFEGAFSINYYFTLDRAADAAPQLYYWIGEDRENADVLTGENASGVLTMTEDSGWQAAVTGIAAKNLDDTVWVAAVYESGGVRYCSGVLPYSIGAYCVSQAATGSTMAPFAQAAAVYGSCAKAYFG